MPRQQSNRPPDLLFKAKSCTGKKRYRSESEALSMLDVQHGYGEETDEIRPYKCGFCKLWHLGHKPVD